MMRGTSADSTISKPVSPIVQAMSFSPSSVSTVAKRSSSNDAPVARDGSALTTAAAAPSANTDAATISSWSAGVRTCNEHSSAQTTRTTASGSAAHVWAAVRSAGTAAAHPMNPRCERATVVGSSRSRTRR